MLWDHCFVLMVYVRLGRRLHCARAFQSLRLSFPLPVIACDIDISALLNNVFARENQISIASPPVPPSRQPLDVRVVSAAWRPWRRRAHALVDHHLVAVGWHKR
jgi:hypothetical protein